MDVCLVALRPACSSPPAGSSACSARTGTDGEPAAVAGGAVVEADGTIRQAGYFFSLFRRAWSARLRHVPAGAARRPASRCCARSAPSSQLIRREWIEQVGHFDELLDGPHASLDYCLRVQRRGRRVRARADGPRPRRCESVDGEPDDGVPSASAAAPQARGRELPTLEPGGRLMSSDIPKTLFLGLGRQRRLLLPLLPARHGARRRVRRPGRPASEHQVRAHRRPRRPAADARGPAQLRGRRHPVRRRRAPGCKRIRELQDAGVDRALRDRRLRPVRAQEQDARARRAVRRKRPRQGPRDGHARRRRHHLLDGLPRRAATARSTSARGSAATASTSTATTSTAPDRARHGDDRLGRRRRPQGLAGALGARAALRSCAQRENVRFVSVGAPRGRRVRRGVRPRARDRLPDARRSRSTRRR